MNVLHCPVLSHVPLLAADDAAKLLKCGDREVGKNKYGVRVSLPLRQLAVSLIVIGQLNPSRR